MIGSRITPILTILMNPYPIIIQGESSIAYGLMVTAVHKTTGCRRCYAGHRNRRRRVLQGKDFLCQFFVGEKQRVFVSRSAFRTPSFFWFEFLGFDSSILNFNHASPRFLSDVFLLYSTCAEHSLCQRSAGDDSGWISDCISTGLNQNSTKGNRQAGASHEHSHSHGRSTRKAQVQTQNSEWLNSHRL